MIRCRIVSSLLLAGMFCSGGCRALETTVPQEDDMEQFRQAADIEWKEVFRDPCVDNWTQHWMLDGLKASVTNTPAGMELAAGPVQGDDSCHTVLWTKESFGGDIRIDYEFTKLDETFQNVNIIYILASGSGAGVFDRDISKWNKLREVPSMRLYFNHMNTLHVSYAAFGVVNEDPMDDYIRARRYMPETGAGLAGTDLAPDYLRTGLFEKGVPHKITVIKMGDTLFMHIRNTDRELLCCWKTEAFPPILEGRIGLRHMNTRSARYRDFSVSVPAKAASVK